ncbi:ABC transporter permease [bacterium]|nr:ABC transporter permease [bacterium]
MGAVFYREMKAYFSSLLAWSLMAAFLAVFGFFLCLGISEYANLSQNAMQGGFPCNVNVYFVPSIIYILSFLLMFFVPLMTMRTFAEDKNSGMLELLFTYPLSDWNIVLGKFFGVMPIILILLALSTSGILFVGKYCTIEWGVVFSGYLGLILFSCAIAATGIFAASITSSQLTAASLNYAIVIGLWLLFYLDQNGAAYASHIGKLSFISHMDFFAKGVICSQDVIYFAAGAVFFIYLAVCCLESRKWRN